jgi:3-deoxy-D-arabino-heptulosonate 7-phosphate (DAHP) synthase
MVTGLQGFIQTEIGAGLLTQMPSFGIIGQMSADSEVHRRLIGAMVLPTDFEGKLNTALQTSDNKALTVALATIRSAYQDAEGKIREEVQTRANEIEAAVNRGNMSGPQLAAATSELTAVTPISKKAMNTAQLIAAALAQNKGWESVEGGHGVVP